MAIARSYPERVDEALETLDHYILDPFWNKFLSRQKPRIPGAPRALLRDLIESLLDGSYAGSKPYRLDLTELERYLEGLQFHGRQHVFLFTLREDQLAPLRSPVGVQKLLGRSAQLYNAHADLHPSSWEPELASVTHDPHRNLLRLQWIENRTWMKVTGREVDEAGKEIIIRSPQLERTVNFFNLDLATGAAELRLQKLHSDAKQARLALRQTYSRLVKLTVGLDLPDPIVLAPAIRFALATHQVEPDSWGTVLPDGGQWFAAKGDRCPVDLDELRAVIELKFSRRPEKSGTVHVVLDGQIDEIQILNPCVPRVYNQILEDVRAWHDEAVAPTVSGLDDEDDTGIGAETPGVPKKVVPPGQEGMLKRIKRLHGQARTARRRREQPPPPSRLEAAAVEYLASHRDRKKRSARGPASPYSIEQFVSYVDEVARSDKRDYDVQVGQLHKDQRWLFRLSYLTAAVALSLILVGAYLIFFTDSNLSAGALAKIVGLLSGGVTAMLRSNGSALRTMRLDLERQWSERRRLQAYIRAAVSLPDPQARSKEMAEVASLLKLRVRPILEQLRKAA